MGKSNAAKPVKKVEGAGGDKQRENRIRVLLADDHKLVREGLAQLLESSPDIEVVGQAPDGRAAVEMARQLKPDVIVMDVTMPILNGIEATRIITRELHTPIIGLSMHEQEVMGRSMREAGAVEYLAKCGSPETLIETVLRCGHHSNE